MKFIHCADLHLDSKIETIPPEKSKIRRDETVRTFERLCEYAEKEKVSAVIIAGDMFDTKRITLKTRGRVVSAIKNAPDVDFLYLSGNHDDDNFISSEKEDGALPQNLKPFSSEWSGFSYGNVNIAGIVVNENNSAYIYDRLRLPESGVNIAVLHGQVAGYKSEDKAELISIPRLKDKNIDYLALGHIHSYSEGKIDERGVYVYCGCPEGRGFDETGAKGFVLITEENGKLTHEFVPFASRLLLEYSFDISAYSDFYEAQNVLLSLLKNEFSPNSLIKVILTGEHSADFEPDISGLNSRLNELFFFGKTYDKTRLKVSAEDYSTDKSVRGEFVREVLASDLSEEDKAKVLMLGLGALKGERV